MVWSILRLNWYFFYCKEVTFSFTQVKFNFITFFSLFNESFFWKMKLKIVRSLNLFSINDFILFFFFVFDVFFLSFIRSNSILIDNSRNVNYLFRILFMFWLHIRISILVLLFRTAEMVSFLNVEQFENTKKSDIILFLQRHQTFLIILLDETVCI